jgi:mannose-1-phosphate guanylyltransferase
MTQLMVLCAGLGTRLGVLSQERPKALVPVGDAPVLQHIVARARAAGFAEALINTHHLAEQLETFAQALPNDFTLHVSRERELLGTAGGVRHARARLTWPLLCWNGDLFLEPPLRELLAAVGAAAALALLGSIAMAVWCVLEVNCSGLRRELSITLE